jgi:hypothetical protein
MPGGPTAHSAPGRVIADRYEVGELIGRGGMAEVFAGVDRRLGRDVAIKLLSPEMAARADVRTRFEAEARAAASLSHPNAVAVFDTGEHDGVPYIVMERLPGDTLADSIAGGRLDPDRVRVIAAEVLGALGAAHEVGLVHRDVKPGNILLAADGRAKVADFGIAKVAAAATAAGDLTTTGQLLGTPAYLAPERLEGAPATPASDLWALGVVLYEALTATKPFSGDTALATARAVAAGTHPPLAELRPDLDPGLVAAVERAMAADPAARFPRAAAMAAALGPGGSAETVPLAHGGTVTDTVEIAPPGGTLLLGRSDLPGPPPAAPVVEPLGPGRRPDSVRRALVAAVAGGLALLVVVLLVRAGSSGDHTTATGASVTTTPPTTASPAAALAAELRDAADHLDPGDGALASIVASRLRQLADEVQGGGGGGDATSLLAVTVAGIRTGQLTGPTSASIVQLLRSVPGVNSSIVDAITGTPSTSAPAPAAPATAPTAGGKGKGGKGKGKD